VQKGEEMKKTILLVFLLLAACVPLFAEELSPLMPSAVEAVIADSVAVAVAPAPAVPSIVDQILTYVNSSAGVTILGAVLVFILGKLFQKKPEWKLVYEKYFPIIMRGVKYAEKTIPNNAPNTALARADAALRFIIDLEPKLARISPTVLVQAITMVHAAAETNENI
jgi:hypothetical protein